MAFLPHPPLPVRGARSLSQSVAIPTRFDEHGAVVVGRRRRVYGVVSAPSTSQTGSVARIETVCSGSKRDEIRRALLDQIQRRNEELKESNKKCEMAFKKELASFSTPSFSAPSPSPAPEPKPPVLPTAVQLDPTHELPSVPERELLPPPEERERLTPAPQREKLPSAPESTETAAEPDTEAAASQNTGVEELYTPPASEPKEEPLFERAFQTISRTVETIVEETKDNIDDVIESFSEPKKEVTPMDSKKEGTSSTEPEEQESEPRERSIGKVLLDAIVEGVPSKPKENDSQAVDKSDLIFLVDSGKIKSLTVSKLRRLLSANDLKTSGRKAELIARLTSFAKQ